MTDPGQLETAMLRELISAVLTCERENTLEWMDYLAGKINRALELLGEPERVRYDPAEDRFVAIPVEGK